MRASREVRLGAQGYKATNRDHTKNQGQAALVHESAIQHDIMCS